MSQTEYSEYSEWVAVGPHAYGRGFTKNDAVANMTSNLPRRVGDPVPVNLFEVPVDADWSISNVNGGFRCDEIRSQEAWELPKEPLDKVDELTTQVEIALEEAFVEGEEDEQ